MADWIKSFDGHLELTSPLSDRQLKDVPAKRGVLGLLAAGDEPIILLTAADMRARLRNRLTEPLDDRRRKAVDLREIARKVVWKLTWSHFETDLVYLDIARKLWPGHYGDLLAWKPAWFVRVDPAAEYPHFFRTRDLSQAGLLLGPFPDGRSASRFVEAVQDAFDLCRDYQSLRQSPNGQRCAYAQMGRCLSPCDGTIWLADYRRAVATAAEFAAGSHEPLRRELSRQMDAAAKELRFERAGAIKARLDRLGQFDKPAYQHVAPVEAFRYVIIQPGPGRQKARVFLACQGLVRSGGELDYPPRTAQLNRVLKRMGDLAGRPGQRGRHEVNRLGLVSSYLFCGPGRKGLIVRWTEGLTADRLAEAVEAAKDRLKLRAARGRKKRTHPAEGRTPGNEPAPPEPGV